MQHNRTVAPVQRIHDYRAGYGEVGAALDRTGPLRERSGDGGFSGRHPRRQGRTRPDLLNGGGGSAAGCPIRLRGDVLIRTIGKMPGRRELLRRADSDGGTDRCNVDSGQGATRGRAIAATRVSRSRKVLERSANCLRNIAKSSGNSIHGAEVGDAIRMSGRHSTEGRCARQFLTRLKLERSGYAFSTLSTRLT